MLQLRTDKNCSFRMSKRQAVFRNGSPLVCTYGSGEVGCDDFKNRGLKPRAAAKLRSANIQVTTKPMTMLITRVVRSECAPQRSRPARISAQGTYGLQDSFAAHSH
jgi:hypothetical protein